MSSQNNNNGTSKNLILPAENRPDFEQLLANLQSEYQPETAQHHLFIEQLAIAHWFLWRRQRAYNAIESAAYEAAGDDPEHLTDDTFRRLALVERYKTAAERTLTRALANAGSIRRERKSECDRHERQARWQAQQQVRERRVAIAESKANANESKEKTRSQSRPAAPPQSAAEPGFQWPDKIVGRPIPKELRDKAIADAKAHWDRISKGQE